MQSFDIGQSFIQHYADHGFAVLPGGSLLDPSVPMTFVMSAGLTQIESTLDHSETHAGERYVLLQTCFRHFDLDKIGVSPVHLSLFGMNGAFSFGRTHKHETVELIWEFLTQTLGLPTERLWATYFSGGKLDDIYLKADVETRETWAKLGVDAARIVGVGPDGGFWKQGGGLADKARFRNCALTTEVFFDRGERFRCGPACQFGCACGRFIEITNVLFIHSQFDEVTHTLSPLVTPFDETVIGIERVAMIAQQRSSVFDIACIAPLTALVRAYSPDFDPVDRSHIASERIIVDHLRALLFLIADGAPAPGKGGRAGIVRRLIRDTLTHQKHLGITRPDFIPDMIEATLDVYSAHYSHLLKASQPLLHYFLDEGQRFNQTLQKGYRQLDRILQQRGNGHIDGQDALELVKHFGVPLVLLENTLARRGVALDKQAYHEAYARWYADVLQTM